VVTGRRGEVRRLGKAASALLTAHAALQPEMQQALEALAEALYEAFSRRPPPRSG